MLRTNMRILTGVVIFLMLLMIFLFSSCQVNDENVTASEVTAFISVLSEEPTKSVINTTDITVITPTTSIEITTSAEITTALPTTATTASTTEAVTTIEITMNSVTTVNNITTVSVTETEPAPTITTVNIPATAETIEIETIEVIETVEKIEKVMKPLKFPVFMYHTSSEDNPGGIPELYVKPSEFEKQIKYLTDNDYTFCIFDDWYSLHNIEKPVFITFDDGYEENYTEIFPILKKYNAKITIFLITSPSKIRLTADMVREMSDSGLVKFESHTLTHANLTEISSNDGKLTNELKNSKTKIEEMTGKRVLAISYPNGIFNEKVKEKAREFYMFGISVKHGMHRTDTDSDFEIRRLPVGRETSLDDFIKLLGK